jgi:hypothetical protein
LCEAEPSQDDGSSRLCLVGLDLVQPLDDFVDAHHRAIAVAQLLELLQQLVSLDVGFEHGVDD